MTNDITFSSAAISSFLTAGILATILPIAAIVIFKLKNKEVKLRYVFVGAVTFVVFALILEQILHLVMLPTVMKSSTLVYVLYGTLCAGVFEETGRFVAYKLFCKKENDPRASLMYGLGHGGVEAVILVGITFLSYAITAVTINMLGTDAVFATVPADQRETVEAQLDTLVQFNMSGALLNVVERILAIILHVSLSVVVFASIKMKGKLWFYPAAVVLHAIFDVPAALYQRGVITSLPLIEILLLAGDIVIVLIAVVIYKMMKKELSEKSEEIPSDDIPTAETVETK